MGSRKAIAMSTSNIGSNHERDIFTVIQELEASNPKALTPDVAEKGTEQASEQAPDPRQLLCSLQQKSKLLSLIKGYSNNKDINEMQQQLQDAIDFLEQITPALEE